MINLNALEVVNREYDLENGFFWVEFEDGRFLQCCLVWLRQMALSQCENGPIYLEQVELDNNGYDQGICYDVNEWAKNEDGGMEHVNDFLIEQAREAGLEIVA